MIPEPPLQWNCEAIQISRGPDPDGLLARSERESGQGRVANPRSRRRARRSSVCRNCSARSISARRRDRRLFDLAEPIPGPSTESFGKLARELKVVIVASLFERRAAGVLSQHRGRASMPTARCSGSTARCTSPTIRFTTRSTTSRRAIWASAASTRASGASARWSAGTSGIRKARAWRRSAARRFCSTPPRSAGILPTKPRRGTQLDAWRTIQRSHAIANGIYVAAVNRVGYEGPPGDGLRILGLFVRRRSVRPRDRQGAATRKRS